MLKYYLTPLLLGISALPLFAQNVFINEFHYDNAGTDTNEFIEITLENASDFTLSDFSIHLYSGADGLEYDVKTLDQFTFGSSSGTYSFYSFTYPLDGIQNGAPDGIALAYQGTLVEFISYEGTFVASGGPADGVTSTDIGVSEVGGTGGTGSDQSLQRNDDGSGWVSGTATKGTVNSNQTLPVTWLYIKLQSNENFLTLQWATALEENNQGFAVESSAEGEAFVEEGFVLGAGHALAVQYYSFDLEKPFSARYYRIKQLDFDGAFSYSEMLRFVPQGEKQLVFEVSDNPFDNDIKLRVAHADWAQVIHQGGLVNTFTNADGQLDFKLEEALKQQNAKGLYVVQLGNAHEIKSYKLIKQ